MKQLEFLKLSEYTQKEMFLQHITQLIQIKIKPNETYNDMFSKLKIKFKESPDELKAINDYIKMNQEHQEDKKVFDTVLNKENDDNLYAVFNLYNLRNND